MTDNSKTNRWASLLSVFLVVFFIGAELHTYLISRALHVDEHMLLTNVKNRDFRQLLLPLSYDQAAPVGFLWASKMVGRPFRYTPHSIRLIPLMAGAISLILIASTATTIVGRWWALTPIALYGSAPFVLYYASDFKQYSSDAAVASALIFLTCRWLSDSRKSWLAFLLAIAAPMAMWFSFTAIFVFIGVILAMLIQVIRAPCKTKVLWWMIVLLTGGSSWIAFLIETVRPASRNAALLNFWRDAFWPLWPVKIRTFTFPLENLVEFFRRPVGITSGGLGVVLAIVGAGCLWRKQPALFALLVLPMLAAMAASGIQMYPFAERLLMFALPSAVLLMTVGLQSLWSEGGSSRVVSVASLIIVLGLGFIRLTKMLPLHDLNRFLQ